MECDLDLHRILLLQKRGVASADTFPVEGPHFIPLPLTVRKLVPGSCYPAAHTNTLRELCFNVRPLAFMEGRYENHWLNNAGMSFVKLQLKTSFLVSLGVLYMKIHTINYALSLVPGRNSISADKLVSVLPAVRK